MRQILIADVVDLYLNYKSAYSRSNSTLQNYKSDLKQFQMFLKETFPNLSDINEVKVAHIARYRAYLHSLKYKPATLTRKVDSLNALYSFLTDKGYVTENPSKVEFDGYHRAKTKSAPNVLEKHEIEKIILLARNQNTYQGYRDAALISLVSNLGLRREELLNIKVSDLILVKKLIKIRDTKSDDVRHLPINESVINAVNELLMNAPLYPDDKLFKSQKGNELSESAYSAIFRKYAELSGLKKPFEITAKVFKDSFCFELLSSGISEPYVMEFTGLKRIDSLKRFDRINKNRTSGIFQVLGMDKVS